MRTHLCGEVTERLTDQVVRLCGWVERRRDLGGLIFIGLFILVHGLEHVGLDPRGDCLSHDAAMRTENPDVFVAGDATGCHQVLHLSQLHGRTLGGQVDREGWGPSAHPRVRSSAVVGSFDGIDFSVGMTSGNEVGDELVVGELDLLSGHTTVRTADGAELIEPLRGQAPADLAATIAGFLTGPASPW